MTADPSRRPPPRPTAIERPRLLAHLDAALAHRLTSVVGGPGTGKTTLLGQWSANHRTINHRAAAGDSLVGLTQTIVDGLRPEITRVDEALSMVIGNAGLPTTDWEPAQGDAVAAALCDQLARSFASTDLSIVVDDVHLIEGDSDAVALLAGLVRHAPPSLHLVLASRRDLPFPTNRLVIDGLATEIDAADLAFTVDEIERLLGADPGSGRGDAEEIARRTGGWAIAAAFATRTRATSGVQNAAGGVLDNERRLFAYFADEVMIGAPVDAIESLRVAAAVPWLTPELVDELGLGDAGQRLADRHRTNIAMVPVADAAGAVAVAPLVREFLQRQPTSADDAARLDELVLRAAEWYESNGSVSAALRCVIRRGDAEAMRELLHRRGADIVASGLAGDVLEAIRRIPPTLHDLPLGLLEAEALQATGEPELARDRYLRLAPAEGPIPAAVAWRLGFLLYMRGETDQATAVLDRGELVGSHPADHAALLAWRASTRWASGQRDAAEKLADEAVRLAASADDPRSLATAYTVKAMVAAIDGDRVANFAYYLKALEQAERARDLMQIVRIHCNCGSHHLEVGDYRQAIEELEPAIRMADLGGYAMFRGLCLTNRAEVLVAWGRLDEAVADLEAARSIFKRIAPDLDSYPLTLLGQVYAARGEMVQARAAFEEAIRLADRRRDVQGLVPALSGLALVRVEESSPAALDLARRATELDTAIAHPKALLALGWVTLAGGDKPGAAELADRVRELASARRDRPSLAEALELAAAVEPEPQLRGRLLHEARSVWAELAAPIGRARVDLAIAETMTGSEAIALAEAAAATSERIGAKRAAARARSFAEALRSGHEGELAVQVLGGFGVTHNGSTVPSSAWQSKVARDVFKMLAVNRGRPIPRDVLVDRLWPGESGDKANNRLSVALSTIRNIVDPERVHPPDHVLVADRDSVALDLAHVSIDVERFLSDVDRGRALIRQGRRDQGLALLRIAETLYLGDLLEEQPYADWATALRTEALTSYLSIATVLAEADTESGDLEAAAGRYLRMLERDPYNEHAHLGAIRALRAAGFHGPAQRLYRNYVAKMAEIDVEPATFPAA